MKNKVSFLLKIIMLIFLFNIFIYPTIAIAADGQGLDDIISEADNFLRDGHVMIDTTELNSQNNMIFNILLGIGIAVTVGVGGYLGIQFLIASAEDKAQIKQKMIPYVWGCVIIYGAFAIWKIIVEILNSIG